MGTLLEGTTLGTGGGGGDDELVKVSSNDLAAQYLEDKVVAGDNIEVTTLNDGSIETLEIRTDADTVGASSSTDDALVRFDGTTGKVIQDSNATLDDVGTLTVTDDVISKGVNLTEDVLILSTTGLQDGGVLSINGGDSTLFDVSAGTGHILDHSTDPLNPTEVVVTWSAFTGEVVPNPAFLVTYVGIDSGGSLIKTNTPFTSEQDRDVIILGFVVTLDGVNVTSTAPTPNLILGSEYLSIDVVRALGRITEGNSYLAGGANLTLQREAGTTFGNGINYYNSTKNPNFSTSASDPAVTWAYNYQDGVGGAVAVPSQTNIDPDNYDDGSGTLASVPSNRFTNQRISFFPELGGVSVIQYGQQLFNTLEEAVAASLTEEWENPSGIAEAAFRTVVSVRGGTTDLTDTTRVTFSNTGKFGYGGGSGGGTSGTQDLQGVYDLSNPVPEILTNSTQGALTLRRGSASDADTVFEIQDNAGDITFSVNGHGRLDVRSTGTDEFDKAFNVLRPNISSGQKVQFTLGKSTTNNNAFEFTYFDTGSTSTNTTALGLYGSQAMYIKPNGRVGFGSGNDGVQSEVIDVDGNITISGTVDGRDVSVDGAKLDTIETGAQVNTVDSVNGATGVVVLDSDDIAEGSTNLYNQVPSGGTTGQILEKIDGTDYNVQWVDANTSGSTPFEQSFTATASQTNFTLINTPSAAWVWKNGAAQDASTWSISGDDIVLSTATQAGDAIEVYYLTDVGAIISSANTIVNINDQTTTSYTAQLSDASKKIRMDNASANTVTIPPNSSVAFPIGSVIYVYQKGAGQTQIVEDVGVTINFTQDLAADQDKIEVQYGTAALHKVGTDEWDIMGVLSV